MQRLLALLNSPIGLLVAGAIISGLFVQYITSRWQQNSWIFQQQYTAERVRFEKQLEQRYKTLDEINIELATVLTHSRWVVVGKMKNVGRSQSDEIVRAYNEAVMKWDTNYGLYLIRLRTQFTDKEMPILWEKIKRERDTLDMAIYEVTVGSGASGERCLKLIDDISNLTTDLSQRMLSEINASQPRSK